MLTLAAYQPPSLEGVLYGDLVLRTASCLDAFSAYPDQTWLPSDATGVTTGTPLVWQSRSSRTRDCPSQISYAHGG